VTQLGSTSNPVDLIPGDAFSVAEAASKMYDYGALLTEAGNGLSRIDTSDGWTGAAADAFRERFKGQPGAWLEAGSCFESAARALDNYATALVQAQNQAGVAIQMWGQGDKNGAQATLANAQSQAQSAANSANAVVGAARDKAPPHPGFWSDVGHFFSDAGHDIENAGADALDALASLGNAAIQNPLADLGMLAGFTLASVSAAGDGLGVALDATGVGAVVGVPVNVVTTAGVLAGGSLMMASAGDLGSHALGDDRVEPINTSGGSGGPPDTADEPVEPDNAEVARNIAGHAAEEHLGTTPEEGAETIQRVLDSPDSLTRPLANDRTAYYNSEEGVIVIENPNVAYGGTAYPGSFDDYLKLR
jgi:hypothetical protein